MTLRKNLVVTEAHGDDRTVSSIATERIGYFLSRFEEALYRLNLKEDVCKTVL